VSDEEAPLQRVGADETKATTNESVAGDSSLIVHPSSLHGRRRRRVSLIGTSFEEEARSRGYRLIAGVDEVGRVFLPAPLRD
jgi:hypothetical protein